MDYISEDIIVKICSYLTLLDRLELSYTSKRLFCFVQETWRDYALSMGWRSDDGLCWLDICKMYHKLQNGWFTGNFKSERIPLNEAAQTRQELFGICKSSDILTLCTNSSISCYHCDAKNLKIHRIISKKMEAAENSVAVSGPIVTVVDSVTDELVILNQTECTEHRFQLPPGLKFDMCHTTTQYIILGTDSGKILLYTMGSAEVLLIHDGGDEISCWAVSSETICISFWTGDLICFSLSSSGVVPVAAISLGGNAVLYAAAFTHNFLYYGTADGLVGRINIKTPSTTQDAVEVFSKAHAGSVYCVATNKTTLVSGGADSRVVFWSRTGIERGSDHMAHIGVVRHIFLNDWLMVTAGDANVIVVWNPMTMTLKHKLHHNPLKIKFLAINESWMAYGAPDSNFAMCVFVK